MKRLEELRKKQGLSQAKTAEIFGITQQAYSHYEKGKREPDYKTLVKLADYFTVSTDYLLGNTDDPTSPGKKTDDLTPETEGCYIFVAGKNGMRKKYPVPAEKMERFKKLVEAGFPEIFDNQDDL